MRKTYVIVLVIGCGIIGCIFGLRLLLYSNYFNDISDPEVAMEGSLHTFKQLLEGMPSKKRVVMDLTPRRTYLSSELASMDGLAPVMVPLDLYTNYSYLDHYKHPWRFMLVNGSLRVWSIGRNGLDEHGDGDDQCVVIEIKY